MFVALLQTTYITVNTTDNIYIGIGVDVSSVIAVFSEAGAILIRIQSLT